MGLILQGIVSSGFKCFPFFSIQSYCFLSICYPAVTIVIIGYLVYPSMCFCTNSAHGIMLMLLYELMKFSLISLYFGLIWIMFYFAVF